MRPTAVFLVTYSDDLVTHCDVFGTQGDFFVTHGATFVNRVSTVYSHFADSNPRFDYAHYNKKNLDSINFDQTVCGYK